MTDTEMPTTKRTHRRDLRDIDAAELRDAIAVTIDRELLADLADDWNPQLAGERRLARLTRYLQTGR